MNTETALTLEPKLEGKKDALTRELTYWKVIASQNEADSAIELCLDGKGLVKDIKNYFAEIKANAHKVWKGICDKEATAIGQVETEVKRVQKLVDDYRTAVYQAEQAAERKRVQEAQAEAARVRRIEEEAALKRAAELEASGHERLADIVLKKAEAIAEAPIVPVESVKVEAAKQAGTGRSVKWDYIVKDKALVPDRFKEINRQIVLKEIAVQAFNGKPEIPGLEISECVKTILRG